MFITADEQLMAENKMLSMQEAVRQLESALSIAKSLSAAAEGANALPGDTASQQALNAALNELVKPGMVLNAPEGISITSPQAVRVASGSSSIGIMSQQNADISAMKRFTVAAGEAISMLARKAGVKLFAAKGKVEIQAQDDALEAVAKKDILVTSVEGRVEITAATELVVNCAGAYIRLKGGNIELGCPGNILLKATNVQKLGPGNYRVPPPELPKGFGGGFLLTDESGVPQAAVPYRITTAEGEVLRGVTSDEGKTVAVYTAVPSGINVEFGKGKITEPRKDEGEAE